MPSALVSSYFCSTIALPVVLIQSSQRGAIEAELGLEVRSLFAADVLALPKVIRPLVLTIRLVYEVP